MKKPANSASALAAEIEKLTLQMNQLKAQEAQVAETERKEKMDKANTLILNFDANLGKILGVEVNKDNRNVLIKQVLAGTALSTPTTVGARGPRGPMKYLTPEDKTKMHGYLVERQSNLLAGTQARQPSDIAKELGVSEVTVQSYASKWELTSRHAKYNAATHPPILGKSDAEEAPAEQAPATPAAATA